MSDLIDRQALLKSLGMAADCRNCDQRKNKITFGCPRSEDFVHICEAINSAPSAEPGWIPVTERLPEGGEEGSDEVLVTCDNGRKHYFVTTGILLNGEWVNVVDNYYLSCEVVAWRPLPECYRGDA